MTCFTLNQNADVMVMHLNALKQKEKGNAHGATSGQLERRHELQLRSTHSLPLMNTELVRQPNLISTV